MKKVAIIGAGASGIVCAKKFIDAGFKVIVFEKSNNTAGVWNYGDTGVIYSSLKTNLPRQIMVFEDEVVAYNCNEPFPDYSAVRNYLANNSKAWSVDEVIRFSCEVTKITPINTDDSLTGWQLTYKHKENIGTDEFDFVAVCNGHYETPNFPEDIITHNEVSKSLSHSKSYRTPNNYGDKVLCIGYSSSGNDITKELEASGREVFVSQMGVTKDFEQKNIAKLSDIKFVSQISSLKNIDGMCVAKTIHGNIIKCTDIIFCTGYKYNFTFLSDEIVSTENNMVKPLYSELIHEKYHSLAFIGLPWRTLPFVLAESQAIFLSKAWFDGSIKDLVNQLETSAEHYSRIMKANLPERYFHSLADQQWDYNKRLLLLVDELSEYRNKRMDAIEEVFNEVAIAKKADLYSYRGKSYSFDKIDNSRALLN